MDVCRTHPIDALNKVEGPLIYTLHGLDTFVHKTCIDNRPSSNVCSQGVPLVGYSHPGTGSA